MKTCFKCDSEIIADVICQPCKDKLAVEQLDEDMEELRDIYNTVFFEALLVYGEEEEVIAQSHSRALSVVSLWPKLKRVRDRVILKTLGESL